MKKILTVALAGVMAAGTALATGRKTKNGMVGMTPDTTAVVSIATQLKEQGYGVGIVTSVAYDDATPASYYAHRPNRNMFVEINHDGARSGFDFIGGAYTHVAEKNIDACANVFDDYRANGYTVRLVFGGVTGRSAVVVYSINGQSLSGAYIDDSAAPSVAIFLISSFDFLNTCSRWATLVEL